MSVVSAELFHFKPFNHSRITFSLYMNVFLPLLEQLQNVNSLTGGSKVSLQCFHSSIMSPSVPLNIPLHSR